MSVSHDEVDLGRPSRSQVLQQADLALFALLCAGAVSQHLFVALQVHCQGGQNDGRIGLVSMPHTEVDATQVQNTPMWLQRTLPPGLKLVGQALIEVTDRAGDFQRCPAGFERLLLPCVCSPQPRTSASIRSRDVRFIALITFKDLGVELPFPVSGHFEVF